MTDDEFDTLLEAAYQETINDPESDADIDMTEIALQVHGDLIEGYYLDLDICEETPPTWSSSRKAIRQALSCYHLLYARRLCKQGIILLTKTKTSEFSEVELEERYLILAEAYKDLAPLDEIEPLARKTLDGVGLRPPLESCKITTGTVAESNWTSRRARSLPTTCLANCKQHWRHGRSN